MLLPNMNIVCFQAVIILSKIVQKINMIVKFYNPLKTAKLNIVKNDDHLWNKNFLEEPQFF